MAALSLTVTSIDLAELTSMMLASQEDVAETLLALSSSVSSDGRALTGDPGRSQRQRLRCRGRRRGPTLRPPKMAPPGVLPPSRCCATSASISDAKRST